MANTGGFLSGFRAGRSDTFQREQAKRQDEALRYKMGLDIFDVQLKVSKENREQRKKNLILGLSPAKN